MRGSRTAWLRGAPLLALALAACEGGTNPSRVPLELVIRTNTVPAEEETIEVGATLALSAAVQQVTGRAVDPPPRIQWRSTAAEIASVDGAGVVTGKQVGTALIIASVSSYADTVRVNVASRVSGAATCDDAASPPLQLEQGQVHQTTGERAVTICLRAAADAEYVMIPFNASEAPDSRLPVSVTPAGTRSAIGPPTPRLIPRPSFPDRPLRDDGGHQEFREWSARALEPRLRAGLAPSTPSFARVPTVGEVLRLNVQTDPSESADGCSNADYRFGRVMAVTARTIVVADTANPRTARPQDTFSEAEYRQFGETFDTLVWRVDTEAFGEPSDVDDNDRVILFFTRAVNELTETNSSSYIAGFVFNRDLFPRSGQNACAGSNAGEMFYLMVPDPAGAIRGEPGYGGNPRSKAFVQMGTVGVLAHEFQHLINDSRRLYVNRAPVWEETWMNEGLSHIAEELIFYAASGLTPGRNVGPAELTDARVRTAFYQYNADNTERFAEFLERPHTSSVVGADELATRGAAWSFLRYAADRHPGDESGLWRSLVNSKTQGLENLAAVLAVNPRDWMHDWQVSIYTDDAFPVDERFQQPSWNFRQLFPVFTNSFGDRPWPVYPLTTIQLTTTRTLSLRGGGGAYLRFRVAAGETASLRTLVNQLPAPSRLRVAIVRTR